MTNDIFFAFKPPKSFSCGFFFLCGRSPCVHVFVASESGEFAFLSEKTLSLKKAEGVGGGAARHPFAHLAAAPQALQAGIEV